MFSLDINAHSMQVTKEETLKSGLIDNIISYESFTGTTTNDAQTVSKQRISYVKKEASGNAKIIAYSKLGPKGIVGANMLELARDFETNNPGWIVLAGINGDYYDPTTKTPVNALVQQGDVIKPTNFTQPRYFSIGFLDDSSDFISSKTNVAESKYALSIYDDTNSRVILETAIAGINTYPSSNQTSIYYNSQYPYQIANARYFLIENLHHAINYGSYFFKGKVNSEQQSTSTIENQLVIVSLNDEVCSLLEKNPTIRVQKHLKEVNNGLDNIIGVGSQPLKDGVVLEFSEINDQNIDFAKARAPRSTVGFTADGDFVMATIDGRQSLMAGADLREEAMVMEYLGCNQAFNLDGGGSTQLVVRENNQLIMLNSPSETYRNNANGILLVQPDVFVSTSIADLQESSLTLNYLLKPNDQINIISHNIYVNQEVILDFTSNTSIDSLINSKINYLSIVVTYEKGGTTYERCFWNERINLENYGFVEQIVKQKPNNFQMTFVLDETINGFYAIVNLDDPDKTLAKLYIAYDGKEYIAIKDSRGYVVDFMNINNSRTFDFSIVYHYRINTINNVIETYETTFPFVYEIEIEEPIPEPEPEPIIEKSGCFSHESTWLLFGLFGLLRVLLRRKHE